MPNIARPTKPARPFHRPTQYRENYALLAYRLTLLGQTDKELALAFEVSEQTINTWKQKHPKFLESIKRGKVRADAEVVESLYKRATGFSKPAVKIFQSEGTSYEHKYDEYYPPEVGAIAFWLKNRQKWRDKPDIEVTVNNEVAVDLSKPPEQWGPAEIEAELKRRGAPLPPLPKLNGHKPKGSA